MSAQYFMALVYECMFGCIGAIYLINYRIYENHIKIITKHKIRPTLSILFYFVDQDTELKLARIKLKEFESKVIKQRTEVSFWFGFFN